MIRYYISHERKIVEHTGAPDNKDSLVWIDMFAPTELEEREVEQLLNIDAPTVEEMQEIEVSSRLYVENGAVYLTATLVSYIDVDNHKSNSITFILKDDKLITLRYSEPRSIPLFLNRVARGQSEAINTGMDVFIGLMEAVIDRLSDILEVIGRELDNISNVVFQKTKIDANNDASDLQEALKIIGVYGDLNGKLRESLLSLSRLFSYLLLTGRMYTEQHRQSLDVFIKDTSSLNEHATHVSNRVNLLLDATLGLINIEQNAIIKIFSVAAVVFLPPTLIASIYGMNFKHLPELDWVLGYPMAVGMMVLSAVLPYFFFKKKKWL